MAQAWSLVGSIQMHSYRKPRRLKKLRRDGKYVFCYRAFLRGVGFLPNCSNPHREDFALLFLLSIILELQFHLLYQLKTKNGKNYLEENKWKYLAKNTSHVKRS